MIKHLSSIHFSHRPATIIKHLAVAGAFFMLFAMPTTAQPVSVPDYSFLQIPKNTLLFYGHAEKNFEPFFRSWRSLILNGNEKIHIIHLGDSHLQADLFSGQIRFRLQTFLQGLTASRGMVSPFLKGAPDSYKINFGKEWKSAKITDNRPDYKLSWWGTTAYSEDSVAKVKIQVNFRNPIPYRFQTLRIYHSPLPQNAYWKIEGVDSALLHASAYNHRAGCSDFTFDIASDTVTCTLYQPDSIRGVEVYGFYFANQDGGITYSAAGINGADVSHYLKLDPAAYDHLVSLKPQMIVISMGTNDAYLRFDADKFKSDYEQWISKIRTACPDIPIILTTPPDSWFRRKRINARMGQAEQAIKEIAARQDCAVWDIYAAMGGKGSSTKWLREKLMQRDRIHFTTAGYQLQGDLLYNALWSAFDRYLDKQAENNNPVL